MRDAKDLGALPRTLLRKLLERSFLRTFKNFKQGDFFLLLFVVWILCSHMPCYYFRLLRLAASLRYRIEMVQVS